MTEPSTEVYVETDERWYLGIHWSHWHNIHSVTVDEAEQIREEYQRSITEAWESAEVEQRSDEGPGVIDYPLILQKQD